jgi:hypothetical protein
VIAHDIVDFHSPPLFRQQGWRIDPEVHDLPLVTVFDEGEVNVGFPFVECRFGIVVGADPVAGLRGGGHEGLALGRGAILQATKLAEPTEKAIQLVDGNRFLELGAGSIQQGLLASVADDRRDGRVCISLALLVESCAAHRDEGDACREQDDNDQEDGTEDDEKFFHRAERNFLEITAAVFSGWGGEGNGKMRRQQSAGRRSRSQSKAMTDYTSWSMKSRLPSGRAA